MDDDKIKEFFSKDNIVSDKANMVFDDLITDIENNKSKNKINDNIIDFENKKNKSGLQKFRKFLAVAASFAIVFVGLNSYAHTKGYENIFFLLKDLTTSKVENDPDEIFSDKDIIISYKYFQVTDSVEMQINEFQVKDNKAKLYLLVKENKANEDTPFYYKVYSDQNKVLYDGKSKKTDEEKIYTEILVLSNYSENMQKLKLEIYNKNHKILKVVTIDLEQKVIEAKTENVELQKISQIKLNEFLKEKTKECYSTKELKDREIIILKTYDIYYSNSKFIVKYLFMMPSEEEFEEDLVEKSDIYINTIEFNVDNSGDYHIIKIDNPEIL